MEARRLRRRIGPIPAIFHTGESSFEGEILSASQKGVFIGCTEIPPVGAEVRIVFEYGIVGEIQVAGQVRWTTDELPPDEKGTPGFGVVFDEWNADYHEFFERLLFT